MGVPPETVQRFLSACVKDLPLVYMIHLGFLPDDDVFLHFFFLDPMYVSEAEREMEKFLQPYKVDYKSKAELYLIPKTKMKSLKPFFQDLSLRFSGNATDIQREFDKFKAETKTQEILLQDRIQENVFRNTRKEFKTSLKLFKPMKTKSKI